MDRGDSILPFSSLGLTLGLGFRVRVMLNDFTWSHRQTKSSNNMCWHGAVQRATPVIVLCIETLECNGKAAAEKLCRVLSP